MNEQRSYRYLIYSLFLLSGVSGLVYQIVWTRMLVLVFGNTMLATSTVLSSFMGGLAAGSFVFGRYIDKRPRPLIRVYAMLEAGIGIFALLFPAILSVVTPIYAGLYNLVEGNIVLLNLVRFIVCFAIIVIPTFLMGGTLPVLIKRFCGKGSSIGRPTGFLYGLNTAGAVIGTIACGYFLLRFLGMQKTTWVAVAINLGVAATAWILSGGAKESLREPVDEKDIISPTRSAERVYSRTIVRMTLIGIGLSGFCALAYEVFWTRMLNLFLNNNIYSFTAILATFLVGIAVGSFIYARYLSRSNNQVKIFVGLQIGIGLISYATPYIFRLLHGGLFSDFSEALTLVKTSIIMIGPTIMMGIAVPLAIQICQRGESHEGSSVGTVYAVNTMGAILGAFTAGFILLPTVGLHYGVIIVAVLNILAGFLPLFSTARKRLRPAWVAVFAMVIVVMVLSAPRDLFRGLFQDAHPNADIAYYKEGKVANVLVYDFKKLGYKDFHLNAVNEASSRLWHVQLFKMLGLLPTLVHKNPSDALMVAFGAGMSAGACARNVESLDCVDLNPDIQGIAAAFTRENLDVINQPNFKQIVNDGRNALMLSPRKYSLIISDATNPKMLDSWTLYSREFYQLVKDRLEPDGVFCQWALIPLPGDAIKVVLNTFRSVFPHMSFWAIYGSSQVLMLGTPERLEIDYVDLESRLRPLLDDAGLADYGVNSVEKFLSFFLIGEDGISQMLQGFDKISTDDLPHAQFKISQDREGIDNCLDLVRYQESIKNYMKDNSSLPDRFFPTMTAYEDIARRLNVGFLTDNSTRYSEAAVASADAGLADANVAHHLNYCPEKKRYFMERVKASSDDLTAHNWLGNIYLFEGSLELAEREFNTTINLKPDHAFARINLALTQLADGDLDKAVSGLLEVRELSPSKRILNSVSRQLAIERILRKLQYQPESAELTRSLGIAYYNDGRILDAIRAYRKAAELDPDDQEIIYNLARIYENHEFVEGAARIYTKLADSWPADMALRTKGDQFSALSSDPDELREWLNGRIAAIDQETNTAEHPSTCDEALAVWNDVDPEGAADPKNLLRAAKLFEKSAQSKPDDLHAYIDAATIYEALGQFEKAADLWEKGFEINPDFEFLSLQAARLKAMAILSGIKTDGSEKASVLRQIAWYYRAINEPELALEYLRESAVMIPDRSDTWLELAETAKDAGMYEEAIGAANQALAIKPGLQAAAAVKKELEGIVKLAAKRTL